MQMMTEVAPERLAMQVPQSSIELMGAVPTVTDTTLLQRAESAPLQSVNNPAVVQTAIQANPEISLRQENWSDAMGQRLVAMISEDGRKRRFV